MNTTEISDYIAVQRKIENLSKQYPFVGTFSVGKSCAGRDITAIRVGRASEYSLIVAAIHGSEAITASVLLRFAEDLCRALKENGSLAGFHVQRALTGRGAIFVPLVNPDGCEIALHGASGAGALAPFVQKLARNDFAHWNANLRGVDINHNFAAGWEELREAELKKGIIGPAPRQFGGYYPESEPETKALVELCRTRRIRHVVALHSQGEVIYWRFDRCEPPRSRKMAEIFATCSGYALDDPTDLAVGGGFKDWFIQEFYRPGFTVELGKGTNPLPPEQAEPIYHSVQELLMLATVM